MIYFLRVLLHLLLLDKHGGAHERHDAICPGGGKMLLSRDHDSFSRDTLSFSRRVINAGRPLYCIYNVKQMTNDDTVH